MYTGDAVSKTNILFVPPKRYTFFNIALISVQIGTPSAVLFIFINIKEPLRCYCPMGSLDEPVLCYNCYQKRKPVAGGQTQAANSASALKPLCFCLPQLQEQFFKWQIKRIKGTQLGGDTVTPEFFLRVMLQLSRPPPWTIWKQ